LRVNERVNSFNLYSINTTSVVSLARSKLFTA
jgi:hypothetical protein